MRSFSFRSLFVACATLLVASASLSVRAADIVVVVDAGHGGSAPAGTMAARTLSSPNNATSPTKKFQEKDLTLDLAGRTIKAVNALPRQGGVTVKAVPTRTTDINLDMATRAKMTQDAGAVIFVSIHFNASNGKVLGSRGVIRGKSYSKSYDKDHAYALALADSTNKVLR
ncbi:MAG: N-acetylmuramoyl-L-alanine amidase, partial [Candidatus Methylacidiphilales bacterium]